VAGDSDKDGHGDDINQSGSSILVWEILTCVLLKVGFSSRLFGLAGRCGRFDGILQVCLSVVGYGWGSIK